MWTSQDTVGFIILAGFCVHIGFSFEGERGIGGGGGLLSKQFALAWAFAGSHAV